MPSLITVPYENEEGSQAEPSSSLLSCDGDGLSEQARTSQPIVFTGDSGLLDPICPDKTIDE